MKSAHRHELETNVFAHRLEAYIERFRPYATTVAGVLCAIVVLMFLWSWLAGSSSARRSGAWDTYNQAINRMPPNLDQLRRTAQDYPGTQMQQLADVTWADGQVWMAARNYIYNRTAAMDGFNKATSAYQGVIQSSDDKQLIGRARLGLARVYEMQNELDKARQQYQQVTGAYANYAQQQVERLAEPDTAETYAWLAKAKPPQPKPPIGPGTPGVRPDFSPGDIALPGATESGAGKADESPAASETFDNMLKRMQQETVPNAVDRYQTDQPPTTDSNATPPADGAPASDATEETAPANPGATEGKPAEAAPPSDTPAK